MSLSGMFEIPPPSGQVKLVMPANAGIQVRFRFKFQNRLDSAGMTTTTVDFSRRIQNPSAW